MKATVKTLINNREAFIVGFTISLILVVSLFALNEWLKALEYSISSTQAFIILITPIIITFSIYFFEPFAPYPKESSQEILQKFDVALTLFNGNGLIVLLIAFIFGATTQILELNNEVKLLLAFALMYNLVLFVFISVLQAFLEDIRKLKHKSSTSLKITFWLFLISILGLFYLQLIKPEHNNVECGIIPESTLHFELVKVSVFTIITSTAIYFSNTLLLTSQSSYFLINTLRTIWIVLVSFFVAFSLTKSNDTLLSIQCFLSDELMLGAIIPFCLGIVINYLWTSPKLKTPQKQIKLPEFKVTAIPFYIIAVIPFMVIPYTTFALIHRKDHHLRHR